jgi:uncharacterized protein DUF4157
MQKRAEQTTPVSEQSTPRRSVDSSSRGEHPLFNLQRAIGNQAALGLLEAKLTRESVDHRTYNHSPNLSSAGLRIQCLPKEMGTESKRVSESSVRVLLVDDDASTVGPGQMRKRDFLARLRVSVCNTANEALAEAGRTVEGCPYIEKWLSFYSEQNPAHIERALRKYAPETIGATSAEEYIPAVERRVRRAVDTWVRTGQITGLPDEIAGMFGGGAGNAFDIIAGMLGSAVSAVFSGIGNAISSAASAVGGLFSGIGRALFKRRDGQTGAASDPQQLRSELGRGQHLDGRVSARMGAAFGHDFSDVRVHTDTRAAGLSDGLNARAFTIGSDVAFGSGEYRPGTLIGDALIAHELAHVMQQRGAASPQVAPLRPGDEATELYEQEADTAAANAVAGLYGGLQLRRPKASLLGMPRLQSCSKKQAPQIRVPSGGQVTPEQADQLLTQDPIIGPRIKDRVAKGRKAAGHTHELGTLDYLGAAQEKVYGDATNPRTGREYTIADISYEMMNAGGFTVGNEIYLHHPDPNQGFLDLMQNGKSFPIAVPPSRHPATIVHEDIHLYGSEAWRTLVGKAGNEGATEFFTRYLLSQQKNEEGGGAGMLTRDSYPAEYEAVKCLVSNSSTELLGDAYFSGTIEPLRQKVGAAKFNAWVAAMKSNNVAGAHSALGCGHGKD